MNAALTKCRRLKGTVFVSLVIGILASIFAPAFAPPLYAHGGGTPRLTSVPVGPYRLYAWTDPEPWRVGPAHVSLAVTKLNPDTSSNQVEIPVTDVAITVTYRPMVNNGVDPSAAPIVLEAVKQDFLGTFYYEVATDLTREGDCQVDVDVSGPEGSGSQQFLMKSLPALSLNWTVIIGAGAALVVLLALIAMWSRSQQPAQPVHRPHRGVRRVQRRSDRTPERKEA